MFHSIGSSVTVIIHQRKKSTDVHIIQLHNEDSLRRGGKTDICGYSNQIELAQLYIDIGKHFDARKLLNDALLCYQRHRIFNHPRIGKIYIAQGRIY